MSAGDRPCCVLINAVGLTTRWLEHAPRLSALAEAGWRRSLVEVLPAVTCTAQATLLTGKLPSEHGVVANGWLFRDTVEIRFWQQSHRLQQAPTLEATLREQWKANGKPFRCAKLFWWFNQGAPVSHSLTPKPHYGADGSKAFGITGSPTGFPESIERTQGPFPFPYFWGPMAGRPATEWIAKAAGQTLREHRPDWTLVYLPHLDYDPQRFGPTGCDMKRIVGELDAAVAPLLDAAREVGARVWVVSEYGHGDVSRPIFPNRVLRHAGLLAVRPGPFGETLDLYASAAAAVCDHQLCHVYVSDADAGKRARDALMADPGVAAALLGPERAEIGLDHPRSGELVLLSRPDAWFAYPYWLDDRQAPDFAPTVDIHRKPGFDPCEMFFDPKLALPKAKVACRLLQKKLGFRALLDVIPLDATIVKGSHGLRAADARDRPILIGDGPPPTASDELAMTAVHDWLFQALSI